MRQSDDASNRQADALDAVAAAPDHHDVLLENRWVRVLDTRLGPGENAGAYALLARRAIRARLERFPPA